MTKDPRVDAYIAKSAPFARPILEHLRAIVHGACPEVVETMKWGMPAFEHEGLLCGMAAFKAHCTFGFWKHALVLGGVDARAREAMGSFGRITSIEELPSRRDLARSIRIAMKLNEDGVQAPREKTTKDKPVARMHPAFAKALAKNTKAKAAFGAFSPSHRKEYVEWIAEAKKDDTRARRIAQAIDWLSQGKSRNWKYERC